MRMGSAENSNAGLSADKAGASLSTIFGKMENENIGGGKSENYTPAQLRAAYRQKIGEGAISAGISKPMDKSDINIRDINAEIPVGKGRFFGSLNEVLHKGERVAKGKNIGYSGEVGDGRLSASVGKSGSNKMGNVTYQIPFKKGGKATASNRADGIAARGKTRGRNI
jgi:hypothetical protein